MGGCTGPGEGAGADVEDVAGVFPEDEAVGRGGAIPDYDKLEVKVELEYIGSPDRFDNGRSEGGLTRPL